MPQGATALQEADTLQKMRSEFDAYDKSLRQQRWVAPALEVRKLRPREGQEPAEGHRGRKGQRLALRLGRSQIWCSSQHRLAELASGWAGSSWEDVRGEARLFRFGLEGFCRGAGALPLGWVDASGRETGELWISRLYMSY